MLPLVCLYIFNLGQNAIHLNVKLYNLLSEQLHSVNENVKDSAMKSVLSRLWQLNKRIIEFILFWLGDSTSQLENTMTLTLLIKELNGTVQ